MKARSALPWSDGAAGPVLRLVTDEKPPPCSADPDLFFSEVPGEIEAAKALCATCPLRPGCLASAVERREPAGVWGGVLFAHGAPAKPPKPRRRRTLAPGTPGAAGRIIGAVGLWCLSGHRRSVENTRINADGRHVCMECAAKRSRKSRARKAAGTRSRLELVA